MRTADTAGCAVPPPAQQMPMARPLKAAVPRNLFTLLSPVMRISNVPSRKATSGLKIEFHLSGTAGGGGGKRKTLSGSSRLS